LLAWDVVFFWRCIEQFNHIGLEHLTADHRVLYCVRKISIVGPWAEIATNLHERTLSYIWTHFTYLEMVTFLLPVEPQLDNVGDNPVERQLAAD